MNITIYRGTHEVGGSCVEIASQGSRIIVDIGMPLDHQAGDHSSEKDIRDLSGPQLVKNGILPEVKGMYPWDEHDSPIDGLLISHAHPDHYGLYSYVRADIHYYLGQATKKLIDISNIFLPRQTALGTCTYLKSGQCVRIGSFKVKPFLMDHSAFDSYAFLIESQDGKTVFYSGDFRGHGRKASTFNRLLKDMPKGTDLLILEGTHIQEKGTGQATESDIENELCAVMESCPSIVFITQASQNIDRLVSVYKAACRSKRIFVIDLYTALILDSLKPYAKIPYPSRSFGNIRVYYPGRLSQTLSRKLGKEILYKFKPFHIRRDEIQNNLSRVAMLLRPSMMKDLDRLGETNASVLIYSMWSGYLERDSMKHFFDNLKSKGIQMCLIHTSGHADRQTLKKLVDTLEPKTLVPIHTFSPQAYENAFPNVKILQAEDGKMFSV